MNADQRKQHGDAACARDVLAPYVYAKSLPNPPRLSFYILTPPLLSTLIDRKGSEVGRGDKDSDTPLHIAARSGFGSLVALLLDLGAPAQVPNKTGKDPKALALDDSIAALFA